MEGSDKPKVLFIGLRWPDPRSSAAGLRTLQILRFLSSKEYSITFCSAAGDPPEEMGSEFPDIDLVPVRINHPGFDEMIAALDPDLVFFESFHTEEYFGWRVAEQAPRALRILDTQDLHSIRLTREEALREGKPFTASLWKKSDIAKRELASVFRCDLSLVISVFEMDWLKANSPVDPNLIFYLPFIFHSEDEIPAGERLSFRKRSDFVFIGSGRHSANTDAIRYLKEIIWPRIRKALPDAGMLIFGAHLPGEVTSLTSPGKGFYIRGWIPEVREVVKAARVNLIPLRFGAGLKGKLFEAVLCGTPSVMTPIGAEGTNFSHLKEIVSNNPESFATKAVELYSNKVLWEKMRDRSDIIIRSHFMGSDLPDQFHDTIQTLRKNLQAHRENNLIGGMLMHHTAAGSKYLSKWIELKEQIKAGKQ